MKTKTAKGTKRFLSAVLAFAMTAGLVPFPAHAAETPVTYNRKEPEVGILNAETGYNARLYADIKGSPSDSGKYAWYNAVKLYGHAYSDRAEENTEWTYSYEDYSKSVLRELNDGFDLEANISATLYNRAHVHSNWEWATAKQHHYNVISTETVSMNFAGYYMDRLIGDHRASQKLPRIGDYTGTDDPYQNVYPYDKNDGGKIKFIYKPDNYYDFEWHECDCGGVYAENVVVTFRDTTAPRMYKVEYSTDGGNNWVKQSKGLRAKTGDTVLIRLTYTEPIRFADDSADHDLSLILQRSGESTGSAAKAKLVELNDSSLIFSYTVKNENAVRNIYTLNTSGLFGSVPLVQLKGSAYGGGTFTIADSYTNRSGGTDGVSTSTSYITDLAGNPIRKGDVSGANLVLDTEDPYVDKVQFDLGLNNADVKQALGKDENSEKDMSDRYLGAGDTLTLRLQMNERTSLKGNHTWFNAVATTNLMQNGTPVTTQAYMYYPYSIYDKSTEPTVLYMKPITITEDMTVNDSKNLIKVTSLSIGETVYDLAGNAYSDTAVKESANTGAPMLDTGKPEITDKLYQEENDGFVYHFTISDALSGAAGINGSFTLTNGGDGRAYPFEWQVTAQADGNGKWNEGFVGTAIPFTQHADDYLHIRPASDGNYADFSNCTIKVTAKDFAGNVQSVELPLDGGKIDWYVDSIAPSVRAGSTARALDRSSGNGTLTAEVRMSDLHGISGWTYAWTDDDTTEPTNWENGDGAVTSDSAEITRSVTVDVGKGETFAKYLWVKATDNAYATMSAENKKAPNESAPKCLGLYTYDLRDVAYRLNAGPELKEAASIVVDELDKDSTLIFMVPVPAEYAGDSDHYAVLALTNPSDDMAAEYPNDRAWIGTGKNLFGMNDTDSNDFNDSNNWYYMTVAKTADGRYTFTPTFSEGGNIPLDIQRTGKTAVSNWWINVAGGAYQGQLDVTVLAGQREAVLRYTSDETKTNYYTSAPISAGDTKPVAESGVQLRVVGGHSVKNYENIQITPSVDGSRVLLTPTEAYFTVSIDRDVNGWNYEDINTESENSYVELVNQTTGDKYNLPLGPLTIASDGKASQTVAITNEDYSSGKYQGILHLATRSGKPLNPAYSAAFYVDMTEPSDDFSLASIQFAPIRTDQSDRRNPYGLADSYGQPIITGKTIEGTNGAQMNEFDLPISWGPGREGETGSSLGDNTLTNADEAMQRYWITVEGTATKTESLDTGISAGGSKLVLWNVDCTDEKIELHTANLEWGTFSNTRTYGYNGTTYTTVDAGFTFTRDGFVQGKHLYLEPNKSNTIAMQRVYDNGRTSSIKYAVIRPMNDAVIDGTLTADAQTQKLTFTPAEGQLVPEGTKIFVWAYQDDEEPLNGKGNRIDMTRESDGTWSCALQAGGAIYVPVIESESGSLYAPRSAELSQTAPSIENQKVQDNGDGTYTLTFDVYDYDGTLEQDGMDADFSVRFTDADGADVASGSRHINSKDSDWSADSAQPSGIYEVSTSTSAATQWSSDRMTVTVDGVYPEGAVNMDVSMTAEDAFGYTDRAELNDQPANYKQPTATPGRATMVGLPVSFNQPVRPVESWAWHESDANTNGFKRNWEEGSFPIAGNGTHSITFKDVFGKEHTQDITTDSFNWKLDLGFSTTELTDSTVRMTTATDTGILAVWQVNEANNTQTTITDNDHKLYAQRREFDFARNTKLYIEGRDGSNATSGTRRFYIRVYIDNIADGAPAAAVSYYIPALGQEFTADELTAYIADMGGALTIEGNVRAWYTTGRYVAPTGDTGTEYLFTPDNQTDTHTFTYQDSFGQTGSAAVSLPSGLTLTVPVNPPEDTTPPFVSVDVYAKRGGAYAWEASFLPTQPKITEIIEDLSYVQGYSFVINALDDSGYTVEATGGSLSGNTLTVSEAGTFHITVTDKSKNANKTEFDLTVPNMIDNTPPNGIVTSVPISMYAKNLYLRLTDNNADVPVILTAPLGLTPEQSGTYKGAYKYAVTDNGTINFAFHDVAGNPGTASYTASGIDTEPPELTVHWSPSRGETNEDGSPNDSQPTSEPVSTSITAHIDSDKAMQNLSVRAGNEDESTAHPLLTGGVAGAPYEIMGQDSKTLVRITAKPDRVTVTYFGNYDQPLHFTAMSPNGKSSTAVLNGISAIDKTAPTVAVTQNPVCRTGCTVPTKVNVTFEPSEWCTAGSYGETELIKGEQRPVEYGPGRPLTLTFTENGTYSVRFADAAGNLAIERVVISSIDSEAPELTVSDVSDTGSVDVTANEPCTLTWGKSGSETFTAAGTRKVQFTENGVYVLTATDHAGNSSIKTVRVGNIDTIPPRISFTNSTIYLMQNSTADELTAELVKGCTVTDNVSLPGEITVQHDTTEVKLDTAGQYTVTYIVTDKAGNVTQATRLVRIIGADTVCLAMDGELVMPDSTAVVTPGTHTLTVQNSTGSYSIKARKGILSIGQLKYLNGSSLSFDENGSFTVTDTGYYTVLVTTQSRDTIRILLYVEQ